MNTTPVVIFSPLYDNSHSEESIIFCDFRCDLRILLEKKDIIADNNFLSFKDGLVNESLWGRWGKESYKDGICVILLKTPNITVEELCEIICDYQKSSKSSPIYNKSYIIHGLRKSKTSFWRRFKYYPGYIFYNIKDFVKHVYNNESSPEEKEFWKHQSYYVSITLAIIAIILCLI